MKMSEAKIKQNSFFSSQKKVLISFSFSYISLLSLKKKKTFHFQQMGLVTA